MRLSLVVGLYNMRREIPRSLHTMSSRVQQLPADDYEIILVDNGSATRFDEGELRGIASNVRYVYVEDASPSPTGAINQAISTATGELVTVVIDGARMFSPGILSRTLQAFETFDDPFVYAPSLHLGAQLQNDSAVGGYDQQVEDQLLQSIDWQDDGYQLFDVSNIDAVPERLILPTFESNCFTVRRSTWDRLEGFHDGFARSTGGGLANWELFARYMNDSAITPILLFGEATFHQFHGGASTNHPRAHHPVRTWLQEHIEIFGTPYAWPDYQPVLFGQPRQPVLESLYAHNLHAQIVLVHDLTQAGNHDAAISIASLLRDRFPHDPAKLQLLAEAFERASRRAEALVAIDEALTIAPTQAELHVTKGIILVGLSRYADARVTYDHAIELDAILAEAYFHRAHLELREGHNERAVEDFSAALRFTPTPPVTYHTDLALAQERVRAPEPAESSAPQAVDRNGESSTDVVTSHRAYIASVHETYGSAVPVDAIEEHAQHGSFCVPELELITQLVVEASPARVLVVGGFLGLSTKIIADATERFGSFIIAVDPNIRHRVFDTPLDHARQLVSSSRVQFVDGFFGARTTGGLEFDLREHEPRHDEHSIRVAVEAVPQAEPAGPFDFVLIDGDGGTETQLTASALPLLSAGATMVITGAYNERLASIVSAAMPGSVVSVSHVDDRPGFVAIRPVD